VATEKNKAFLEFVIHAANNPLFAAFLIDTTICQCCAGWPPQRLPSARPGDCGGNDI
jgi:hypothetical protein